MEDEGSSSTDRQSVSSLAHSSTDRQLVSSLAHSSTDRQSVSSLAHTSTDRQSVSSEVLFSHSRVRFTRRPSVVFVCPGQYCDVTAPPLQYHMSRHVHTPYPSSSIVTGHDFPAAAAAIKMMTITDNTMMILLCRRRRHCRHHRHTY